MSIGPLCTIAGQTYWINYSSKGLASDAVSPAHTILDQKVNAKDEVPTMAVDFHVLTLWSNPRGRIFTSMPRSADDQLSSPSAKRLKKTQSSPSSSVALAKDTDIDIDELVPFTLNLPFLKATAALDSANTDPKQVPAAVIKLTVAKDAAARISYKEWQKKHSQPNLPSAQDAMTVYSKSPAVPENKSSDKKQNEKGKAKFNFKHILS